jgi:hypothetical protein
MHDIEVMETQKLMNSPHEAEDFQRCLEACRKAHEEVFAGKRRLQTQSIQARRVT